MSAGEAKRFAPPSGAFTVTLPIRFSQCDPAGIVYFPHYFDLVHACLEDWYEQVLNYGFTKLVGSGHGAPIVHAECDFSAPSRMGDRVQLTLLIERLGRASVTYRIVGHADGHERFSATIVTAFLALASGKAVPIPPEIRAKMETYQGAAQTSLN